MNSSEELFRLYSKRLKHKNISFGKSYRESLNYVIFELSKSCKKIRVLDLCERFDPYMIAGFARKERLDYQNIFDNIMISRAFTVYQFSESIREMFSYETEYDVLIFSSLLYLFLDENVSINVRLSIFEWFLKALKEHDRRFYIVERFERIFYGGSHGKDTFDFDSDNRKNKKRLEEFQKSSKKRGSILF